jgi:multiple sugar transport system permease protein
MAWDSKARRMVVLWLPLTCFVLILLFPFYWMTVTAFKPDAELYDFNKFNPLWISSPTLDHIYHLLFKTSYPSWLWTTMMVAFGATFLSLLSSALAAYAIQRLRFKGSQYVGLAIYLAYLVPPSILFIPLATMVVQLGLFDSPMALILVYPTFLVPFCTWLLIGYFKSIPFELEECALIDGATRLQILRQITLPLAVPGLISAGIFSFTLSPSSRAARTRPCRLLS